MHARILLISLAIAGAVPLGAQGRPLGVSGVRPLVFGVVFPGMPLAVSRTDAANSGQLDLAGNKNADVQLTFTLPNTMTGPAGATMPVVFGGSDAGYSASQSVGSQVAFDPRTPFLATLNKNGRGSVFVGATVNPPPTQRAGAYTGTITLSIVYFP
jgi:hypothetical protein